MDTKQFRSIVRTYSGFNHWPNRQLIYNDSRRFTISTLLHPIYDAQVIEKLTEACLKDGVKFWTMKHHFSVHRESGYIRFTAKFSEEVYKKK